MNLTKTVTFRISEELYKDVESTGKEIGLPTSALCRMAVIKHVKEMKKAKELKTHKWKA